MARVNPEKAASDLLETSWRTEEGRCPLPVNPFKIADRLGLRVTVTWLESDVSGMLAKRPDQDPEVYVNASDSANRQRFSCAHEIGHYTSRATSDLDDSYGYIDRRGPAAARGDNPDEIYANKFAAALLMPEDKVKEFAGRTSTAAMAVKFGVSVEAMKFRLENLDLPSY